MEPIEQGIPKIAQTLSADRTGAAEAARAMLTTDTVTKESRRVVRGRNRLGSPSRNGEGCGDAVARDGDDAAVLTTDARVEPVCCGARSPMR